MNVGFLTNLQIVDDICLFGKYFLQAEMVANQFIVEAGKMKFIMAFTKIAWSTHVSEWVETTLNVGGAVIKLQAEFAMLGSIVSIPTVPKATNCFGAYKQWILNRSAPLCVGMKCFEFYGGCSVDVRFGSALCRLQTFAGFSTTWFRSVSFVAQMVDRWVVMLMV